MDFGMGGGEGHAYCTFSWILGENLKRKHKILIPAVRNGGS
jgi:hypothetical protein